jgi:hypothetical protein
MTFITNKQNTKQIWVGPFSTKTVIFYEKRLSLNVEQNQPMASLCYF